MGLDMYLEREIYIGAIYKHSNVKGKIDITKGKHNTPIKVDLSKVSSITEHVAYWRKANAIHNWFVQNVQDGVDECQRSYVSYEQLQELVILCKQTMQKLDNTVPVNIVDDYKEWDSSILGDLDLVPISGFFFGSTKVDSYFYEDLQDTIDMLSDLSPDNSYYYRSSW